MPARRIQQGVKAVLVLLLCFLLGVFITHYLLAMRVAETAPKPPEAHKQAKEKHDTSELVSPQTMLTPLVAVSLPPPPHARSGADNAVQAQGKGLALSETPPASSETERVDTRNHTLIAQGLSVLKSDRQAVPQILISLPVNAEQREQVINTLRACMGVTLAKVSEQGAVLAQEKTGQPVSPFLRLVDGKLSQQEQLLARSWQNLPGNIVRFYPETADAKVLGGLLQVVQGPLADKKITAEYRMQPDGLSLVNIQINGQAQPTSLRLSASC